MSDPYVGKLTYFRVYSGKLKAGDRVLNTTTGKTERIGRILQMHANHREEREEIGAGEIAAGVGLKATTTGDTLAAESAPIVLESMTFPEPVISVAVEPKSKADQDKLGSGPRAARRGGSDLPRHLRRGDRPDADRRHGRAAPRDHRRPAQARVQRRRERRPAAGRLPRDDRRSPAEKIQGRFVRQTGGSGQYGDAVINLYPQEPGAGYEFEDKIVGGKIPKEYIPAVDAGIQEAMGSGILAGYPVVDVRVELVDGSYHDVDSSERAFKIAGSMAFKEAMKRAKPKLLEPVMAVEVTTPEDYLGDVMGNLNSRRGRIESMNPVGNAQVVKASVPLSEMFGYATDLRSMSQGRADFTHGVRPLRRSSAVDRQRDRRAGRRRLLTSPTEEEKNGQAEVRALEAARQRRHDRAHRPRQDHAHRGDHEGARRAGRRTRSRATSRRSTTLPRSASAASRSTPRTSSTRRRTATTRTSTARVTPTTSRT